MMPHAGVSEHLAERGRRPAPTRTLQGVSSRPARSVALVVPLGTSAEALSLSLPLEFPLPLPLELSLPLPFVLALPVPFELPFPLEAGWDTRTGVGMVVAVGGAPAPMRVCAPHGSPLAVQVQAPDRSIVPVPPAVRLIFAPERIATKLVPAIDACPLKPVSSTVPS